MRVRELIWLDDIVEKLWVKHHVGVREVREVFEGATEFRFVEKGHQRGEDVYAAMGRTEAGRYLIVFFVSKKDANAIVISAREMTATERKRHAKR